MPRDDKSAAREAGMRQMFTNLVQIFQGNLATSAAPGYSSDDRSVLLEAMHVALPSMRPAFSQDVRAEFTLALNERRSRFNTAIDLERIDCMIATLEP